jgi:hypothetical protein
MSSKSPGQKRKQIIIQIVMLDDQEVPFQIDVSSQCKNIKKKYLLNIFNYFIFKLKDKIDRKRSN